jgi:hypothetical protein
MKRSTTRCAVFCTLLLGTGLVRGASDQVVLAMPARHDLVNLGFDFLSMFPRSLNLVCYSGSGESLALERYNAAAGRWLRLGTASWATAAADKLVLVGEGTAVSQLRSGAVWAEQANVVGGQRLHEVANAVNGFLRLNASQWRRLADTYGFTLLDRNVDARRYGRYGRPGGRRAPVARPMPAAADGSLILEAPAAEPPPPPPPPPTTEHSGGTSAATPAEAPAAATEAPVADVAPAAAPPVVPEVVAPADVRPEDK